VALRPVNPSSYGEILDRIEAALTAARIAVAEFKPGNVLWKYKSGRDPVTEADIRINKLLREMLVLNGEGWLSEESADDPGRLLHQRVWVVDPLDGTREFVAGIPEWCISIGLIEGGNPVAGGVCNPDTGEVFLGAEGEGVTCNGKPAQVSGKATLQGATLLASRTEVSRGEWRAYESQQFVIRPVGSVAYKLAMVAAGFADATCTLCPKHEWDIAAGVALVESAGGRVSLLDGSPVRFNSRLPRVPNLLASGPGLYQETIKCFSVVACEKAGDNEVALPDKRE
jgi:myo-inositol-1(or 4)-monophosphatase